MYNPFVDAAFAAYTELSSERAINFYHRAGWAIAQRAIDDTLISITYAVYAAYTLGRLAGEAHYNAVSTVTEADADAPAIEGSDTPLMLEGCTDITIVPHQVSLPVPSFSDAIVTEYGVTFAPVIEAEVIDQKALPAAPVTPALPQARSEKEVRTGMMKFTRTDLRAACTDRGIAFKMSESKSALCTKLIQYQKDSNRRLEVCLNA